MSMPQRCSSHVGVISFDFYKGPLARGKGLAYFTTLPNILCAPNNVGPEETKSQGFGTEGPRADVASGETLMDHGH